MSSKAVNQSQKSKGQRPLPPQRNQLVPISSVASSSPGKGRDESSRPRSTSYAKVTGNGVYRDVIYAIVTESSPDGVVINGVEIDPIRTNYAYGLLKSIVAYDQTLPVQGNALFCSHVARTYHDFKQIRRNTLVNETLRYIRSTNAISQIAAHISACLNRDTLWNYLTSSESTWMDQLLQMATRMRILDIDDERINVTDALTAPNSQWSDDQILDVATPKLKLRRLSEARRDDMISEIVSDAVAETIKYIIETMTNVKVSVNDGSPVRGVSKIIREVNSHINEMITSAILDCLPNEQCETCTLISGLLLSGNITATLYNMQLPNPTSVPYNLSQISRQYAYWINLARNTDPSVLSSHLANKTAEYTRRMKIMISRPRQLAKEIALAVAGTEGQLSEQYGQHCVAYNQNAVHAMVTHVMENALSYAKKGADVITIVQIPNAHVGGNAVRTPLVTIQLPSLTMSSMRLDKSITITNGDKDLPTARLIITNVDTGVYNTTMAVTNALTNALNDVLDDNGMSDVMFCRTSQNGYLTILGVQSKYNKMNEDSPEADVIRMKSVFRKFNDMLANPATIGKALLDKISAYAIKSVLNEARLGGKIIMHLRFVVFNQIYIPKPYEQDLSEYRSRQTTVVYANDDYVPDKNDIAQLVDHLVEEETSKMASMFNAL